MPRVSSSAIDRLFYDDATHDLVIVFRGTGAYLYRGVPQRIYAGLLASDSKGRFFNERIRDRYPCERLGTHRAKRIAADI
ncbi:KTSC domain-containing protein [Propylenella binzhouense]|uniref:KTSC domain-containing protein n=1 Tax=Propylenella binzhouense TaxID=2555902 RepID=A0A964WU90_9HYPH|nr:KTSC domain-containing protein [Propylenella binzhouense]MYZ48801.1 KTSC domain-containing protein [Propylenella binzhouense]